MRRVETHDPDTLEFKGGGGCLALFGTPFLLAGLFIMSIPFTEIEVKGNMPRWGLIPFGGVFALVGSALVFGRRGVVIDRGRKQVTSWWGLLFPIGSTERPLEDFTRVALSREARRTKNSSYTVYPVRLSGSGKPVSIGEPRDYTQSRKLGEELARFLNLDLEDASSGSVVRRGANELDESVRDRARRTGEKAEVPPPPDGLRTEVSFQGSETVLEIPPPGFTPVHGCMALFSLVIPAIVLFVFVLPILRDDTPDPFKWVFVGFIGFFFMALPVLTIGGIAFSSARTSWTVTVSPSSLKLQTRGAVFTRTLDFAAGEIEELEVRALPEQMAKFAVLSRTGGGSGIIVRTDRRTASFGGHLRDPELRYLHAAIKSALTS